MAGYSEGSTTSDSQTFESNVTFTRQRSARLQLLHKSLTASVLQSGIYGQKGARPIPNGPGQPQLGHLGFLTEQHSEVSRFFVVFPLICSQSSS
jgi:hypothetical protein